MYPVSGIQRPMPPNRGVVRTEQHVVTHNQDTNIGGEVTERNGNSPAWWLSVPSSTHSTSDPFLTSNPLDSPTPSGTHQYAALPPASPSSPNLLLARSRSRSRSPTRSIHLHPSSRRAHHHPYSSSYLALQSRTEELEHLLLTTQEASEQAERMWTGRIKKLTREGEALKRDLERTEEAWRELKEECGNRRKGKRKEGPVIQWDESSFIDAATPSPDHQVGESSRSSHLLSQPSPSILRYSPSTIGPTPSTNPPSTPPVLSYFDIEKSSTSPFHASSSAGTPSRLKRSAMPKSVSFSNSISTPTSTIRGRTLGSELGDDEWWAYQESEDGLGLPREHDEGLNHATEGPQKKEEIADGEEVLNEVESLPSGAGEVRGSPSHRGGLREVEARRLKGKVKERPRMATRSLVGIDRKSSRPIRPLNTPIESGNSMVGVEMGSNVGDAMVAGIAVVLIIFRVIARTICKLLDLILLGFYPSPASRQEMTKVLMGHLHLLICTLANVLFRVFLGGIWSAEVLVFAVRALLAGPSGSQTYGRALRLSPL